MRRLIALEQPPGTIRERTSENELATEYECCYCTSKVVTNISIAEHAI